MRSYKAIAVISMVAAVPALLLVIALSNGIADEGKPVGSTVPSQQQAAALSGESRPESGASTVQATVEANDKTAGMDNSAPERAEFAYLASNAEAMRERLQALEPDMAVSKLRLYGGDSPSSVLYYYYFEGGEQDALKAALRYASQIKTSYPEMEHVVFHIGKGERIEQGIQTVGGLGLLYFSLDGLPGSEEIAGMSDSDVKAAIGRHAKNVHPDEFDTSVLALKA